MISIAISVEAFERLRGRSALASVGYENNTEEEGERLIVVRVMVGVMVGVRLGYIVTDAI